jgi:PEP-CTERM motif
MKALSRRVKAGSAVGVCSMIAMTCSLGLGQATPDRPIDVPEPGSFALLGTGLVLMIFVAWWFNRPRPSAEL